MVFNILNYRISKIIQLSTFNNKVQPVDIKGN